MQRAGFEISIRDTPDLASVKQTLGIPTRLASCHTGVANGYLFEGHVPPDLVTRVLRERPAIVGLFVPGMPMGSPGMEGPNPERYEVLALDRTGRTTRVRRPDGPRHGLTVRVRVHFAAAGRPRTPVTRTRLAVSDSRGSQADITFSDSSVQHDAGKRVSGYSCS